MKFRVFPIAAAVLMTLGVTTAHAQTFTPMITQTVGTGSEESFFTLDFQDGTVDHSYAFGYKYDGTKSGADILSALSSGAGLGIGYYPGYGPGTTNPLGVAVNSFSDNGHSEAGFGNNYWSYWKGTDGLAWSLSGVGPTSRSLSNGSWDGWSWDVNSTDPAPVTPAAVPEASSIVSFGLLLGMGLIVARRKKTA